MKVVAVFCGSSSGSDPHYADEARKFGSEIARRRLTLVYGGGRVGLMAAVADAAIANGGEVVGVMPRHLVEREIAHNGLTRLIVVESMHARKQRIAELADAFVLLPGGFGSWEEFCEAVTWSQLGLHHKACAILNVRGYYASLLSLAARAVDDGFVWSSHVDALVVESDSTNLLDRLAKPNHQMEVKWLSPRSQ